MKILYVFFLISWFFPSAVHAEENKKIPVEALEELSESFAEIYGETFNAYNPETPSVQPESPALIPAEGSEFIFEGNGTLLTTKSDVKILSGAAKDAMLIESVGKGEILPYVDHSNGWYAVKLKNPKQGLSHGWVSSADAVIQNPRKFWVSSHNSDTDESMRAIVEGVDETGFAKEEPWKMSGSNVPEHETYFFYLQKINEKELKGPFKVTLPNENLPADQTGSDKSQPSQSLITRLRKKIKQSFIDEINRLTRVAAEMRDEYQSNPYFYVSGFTLHGSVTPGISMEFTFK